MTDARFEDGADAPLRLIAREAGEVPVISALLQDAVLAGADMRYDRAARRFAFLLNRFRWEDRDGAERAGRGYERARALLLVSDVTGAASRDLAREGVLSLLSVGFLPGDDGTGELVFTFAGGGALRLSVECLDLRLDDVTRPYAAPSGKVPEHPDE